MFFLLFLQGCCTPCWNVMLCSCSAPVQWSGCGLCFIFTALEVAFCGLRPLGNQIPSENTSSNPFFKSGELTLFLTLGYKVYSHHTAEYGALTSDQSAVLLLIGHVTIN